MEVGAGRTAALTVQGEGGEEEGVREPEGERNTNWIFTSDILDLRTRRISRADVLVETGLSYFRDI